VDRSWFAPRVIEVHLQDHLAARNFENEFSNNLRTKAELEAFKASRPVSDLGPRSGFWRECKRRLIFVVSGRVPPSLW
jgi:hypothetical protein